MVAPAHDTLICPEPSPPDEPAADAVEGALVGFILRREERPHLDPEDFAAGIPAALRTAFLRQARAVLAASAQLAAGSGMPSRIGGYRILGRLGLGGTACVFAAESLANGERVAVKLLHPHLAAHAHSRARLRREAQIAAVLRHPRLVRVRGCGEDEGRVFLVMDHVAGRNLHDVLQARTTAWLADHRALARSFAAVADALHTAHAHGFVHRDLKPGNLMLDADGALTVLDFGLSTSPEEHLTCSSDFLGTPGYMSPEQASGAHAVVGPASDIYSLGAVLYECVTARPAVPSGPLPRVLDAVRAGRIAPAHKIASVARPLSAILARCLARNPRDRYASAAALAADLRAFASGSLPSVMRTRWWLCRAWSAAVLVAAGACVALQALGGPVAAAPVTDRASVLTNELFDLAQRGDEAAFARELQRALRDARPSSSVH